MKLSYLQRKIALITLAVIIVVCAIGIFVNRVKVQNNIINNGTIEKSISDRDNGTTITLKQGTRLKVILHSTYWKFNPIANGEIVKELTEPTYAPDTSERIPGMGTGTVTVEYQVIGGGQTTVSASRTSCGEAMGCVGNQGSFLLHVVVN